MQTVIKASDVKYVADLYPRLRPDDSVIERYRDALDALPPIVVARDGILVDGYHRWQAHVREGATEMTVIDLGNITDTEIFNESIIRNASHGQQLSRKDKQSLAAKLWQSLVHLGDDRKARIVELLAVSERSVEEWTKGARKAEKDDAKAKAWDMWLDCNTQETIAAAVGVDRTTVGNWMGISAELREFAEPPESRQHFDIWQFATADKDAGQQSYFGACPPQIIENLLWFFTEQGDTVVDLFAGSGTTIDVAKRMGRRVWASDIRGNHYSPHLPIHTADASQGWPTDAPAADLAFLDPPYWKQAAGRYSSEPNELAEMDIDSFYSAWAKVVSGARPKAKRLAFIISPTQNEDGSVVDHANDMLRICLDNGWEIERRIIVPYSTQQATGQQVTWARENKRMLKLYRDLVVVR